MFIYKMRIIGVAAVLFTLSGCATARQETVAKSDTTQIGKVTGNLDNALSDLATQIVNSMLSGGKKKVAIVEFSDLEGRVSEFGKYLAEELITRLFMTKKFEKIIERQSLDKIISEQKLSLTGLIEPASAVRLGQISGVDAIVTGTITDLGVSLKVNARIISTETGAVFAVAATKIEKDETVRKLMSRVSVVPRQKEKVSEKVEERPVERKVSRVEAIIFKEDFSEYETGDPLPEWGANVTVLKAPDGRKCLSTQVPRLHTVSQRVNFPSNFSFEMEFVGKNTRGWAKTDGTNPVFIDIEGKPLKIVLHGNAPSFQLPGTAYTNAKPWNTEGVFKLVKKGSTYKIYWKDDFILSGSYPQYSQFVYFKFVVHQCDYITNIIITDLGD